MIVLTKIQRDLILAYREQFKDILNQRKVDVNPIEIKNSKFILPEEILTDPNFVDLISQLKDLGDVEIRPILETEKIVYDFR